MLVPKMVKNGLNSPFAVWRHFGASRLPSRALILDRSVIISPNILKQVDNFLERTSRQVMTAEKSIEDAIRSGLLP
jgi:hypothetical protein